jgi:hypothetical protein
MLVRHVRRGEAGGDGRSWRRWKKLEEMEEAGGDGRSWRRWKKLVEIGAAGKVGLATSTSLAIPSQHCPVPETSTAASMYFPKMQKSEHGCKVKEKSEDVQS